MYNQQQIEKERAAARKRKEVQSFQKTQMEIQFPETNHLFAKTTNDFNGPLTTKGGSRYYKSNQK